MSEKDKKQSESKIKRMVIEPDDDHHRFGYRPPKLKAKAQKDTEVKGYVPPKKPPRPSSSDSGNDKKKS
jgi:hypothetical protein